MMNIRVRIRLLAREGYPFCNMDRSGKLPGFIHLSIANHHQALGNTTSLICLEQSVITLLSLIQATDKDDEILIRNGLLHSQLYGTRINDVMNDL